MNTYGSREGDVALQEASAFTRRSQDPECKRLKSWSSLAAILPALLFFAGCRHAEPQFADMASLTAPTASRTPYAVPAESSGGLKRVTLTHQFDPAWPQPPDPLFHLGPGGPDKIRLLD